MPKYVGVHLLVEGLKIKCPCPLPPLKSSNGSAPKHRGPVKKEPPADKIKPLPKMLKSAATPLQNTSSGVPSPPLLPPEPPVPVPKENFTVHLPMTVKSIHLPYIAQSHSKCLWKRKSEVSGVCSEKDQLCTVEKHQSPSLSLKITASKQSRPGATSTMIA